ncbi:hypothetical protein ACVIGA_003039 [Bradyrhizobium sp. USDA 3240]
MKAESITKRYGACHADDRRHRNLEARPHHRPRRQRRGRPFFDGAIKLLPLPVVTETMDKMGFGASDTLARSLGIITIVCTLLYSVPPTSILGAILLTGYLGGAIASHVRIGSPLFSHTLFGLYLGLMVWGGLYLRDGNLRALLPFRR